MKAVAKILAGLLAVVLMGLTAVYWVDRVPPVEPAPPSAVTPELLARGAQLASAGNCKACHTERGGAAFAGGRAIATPFGTVYSSNITPDSATGLGSWSADDFWRALHHGVGRDGRRLNPAFPYTEFSRITRADSDALFAWLRSQAPIVNPHKPHALGLYGSPTALALWRALFFRAGTWQDDGSQSAEWNRGAYLVNGVGHCVACHGGRNALGGQWQSGFGGGVLPTRSWYAPSLQRTDEAGVADWPLDEIMALLRSGVAPRGRAQGPMAEVVQHGTQHLPQADLRAIAVYLKALPAEARREVAATAPDAARAQSGKLLYADHCAGCHGKAGEGGVTAQGVMVVPALAGNRLVTQEPAINLVRLIALGGFGVETSNNPRPFSMPGFAYALSDDAIADIATYLRNSWGAQAGGVSSFDVGRWRGGAD